MRVPTPMAFPAAFSPNDIPAGRPVASVSGGRFLAFAFVAFGIAVVLAWGVFHWHWDAPFVASNSERAFALVMGGVGLFVHETFHALGFRLSGAPGTAVRMGFSPARLGPFTHCTSPLRARTYRWVVGLPGCLLGVVPFVLGCWLGDGGLAIFGAVMLGVAGGDVAVLWSLRRVGGRELIFDDLAEVSGHRVLAQEPSLPVSKPSLAA